MRNRRTARAAKPEQGAETDQAAHLYLSKRERQIMDVVYRRGEATAETIAEAIPHPPSRDAVRRLIRILEEKGHLRHRLDGPRHVYHPAVGPENARRSALKHMIRTYFGGSAANAMTALMELETDELAPAERAEFEAAIAKAEREGR